MQGAHRLAGKRSPSANSSSTFFRAFGYAGTRCARRVGQRKHRQLAAERSVVAQASVAADGAQASGRIRQTGRKTDTGPAADAGKDRDVLLAVILIGRDVADDA